MTEQILFDRLAFVDKLTAAGIAESEARAHAEAMDAALRESVATKSDIVALKQDITRLENAIALAVRDMTIRMGVGAVALFGALSYIKFFG